ncbi:MAG TPA: UDP-N-acetylglucosamine 2-epimerase [Candidatus Krumholzibacteria bacterium]|nr:UDP-N-acetylglucosamine 2-epimerase [Candidatus Krumholzibacteria bacterium]HPD70987.1 UDP-N-acetylglucosamine 2-epimerase [Candidatus Krumholzibacteria bacterium]HRY39313.1 UDP-N-acetylglucosamine 2-epimerase [Candidatus Krumholzibacteria bacterium]
MSRERRIAIVTTSRADYGHLRSLIRAIQADRRLELRLLVSGSHLDPARGESVRDIEADGAPIWRRLPIQAGGDDERAALVTVGNAVLAVAPILAEDPPDVLVVLGDRSEILAFGLAALMLRIPLAHIHGGEVTGGAIDESIRHALTKLATYHFVATAVYAENVIQLGEDPARVFTVGAPGLDGLDDLPELSRAELLAGFGLDAGRPTALVSFHPVTTEGRASAAAQADAILAAIAKAGLQAVLTGAGADAHGGLVDARFAAAAAAQPDRYCFRPHLGRTLFVNCLRRLDLMIGNSSSGIIEAPSFGLPVVNVGDRQRGRLRAANVLEAAPADASLAAAISTALDAGFRARCRLAVNPYAASGPQSCGERIKEILATVSLGGDVVKKRFRRLDGQHA